MSEKVDLLQKHLSIRKGFTGRSDILEFDVTDDEEDLTDIEDAEIEKELEDLDSRLELEDLDNRLELEDLNNESELEDFDNESELEDIEGQVEIDSDDEVKSELTGESEYEFDDGESADIENFAVGPVKELEIPEAKPGLSVALEVDTEDGVVKLAEVPSEAVFHEKIKKVDDL